MLIATLKQDHFHWHKPLKHLKECAGHVEGLHPWIIETVGMRSSEVRAHLYISPPHTVAIMLISAEHGFHNGGHDKVFHWFEIRKQHKKKLNTHKAMAIYFICLLV